MPSTTRGSILISTANDIGEALVEKLGGVGYSPNEWKDKFNLCGIAPVDSAPALSVLSDSAGTGDERGSILIATADAIGAILNKKYNVLRGFKPKEWASACRKMKALESGSVASSSIASFSDGADTVPIKSWEVEIAPTLTGKSAIECTQTGKNLASELLEWNASNRIISPVFLKSGTYTVSFQRSVAPNAIYIRKGDTIFLSGDAYATKYNSTSFTFTADESTYYYVQLYRSASSTTWEDAPVTNPQIEIGSTATTYEPYTAPTVSTVNLGRTIYGGTADVVNGTCSKAITETKTFDGSDDENWLYSSSYGWFYIDNQFGDAYRNNAEDDFMGCNLGTQTKYSNVTTLPDMHFACTSGTNSRFAFKNTQYPTVEAFKEWLSNNNMIVAYTSATFTPFTFTPITPTPETALGTNNFWADEGDSEIEYYKAPTPYARKTATGGIANFSDQRTDLPLTKAIANISPSIAGKSAVNLVRAGKNLLPNKSYLVGANTLWLGDDSSPYYQPLKAGAYTVSLDTSETMTILLYENDSWIDRKYNATTATFVIDHDGSFAIQLYKSAGIPVINNWQLEIGSTASAYVPYSAPTTYTAELGETVYGGSVDFVSGAKSVSFARVDMGSLTWQYDSANTRFFTVDLTSVIKRGSSGWITDLAVDPTYTVASGTANDKTISEYATTGYIYIKDTDYTDPIAFKASLSGKYLTYPLATPTESAIPGRVISPSEGVNNLWNNAGGDTDVEYFEQE